MDTKVDKTVDDDYYILTLASLAAELKARGKNQAAVRAGYRISTEVV